MKSVSDGILSNPSVITVLLLIEVVKYVILNAPINPNVKHLHTFAVKKALRTKNALNKSMNLYCSFFNCKHRHTTAIIKQNLELLSWNSLSIYILLHKKVFWGGLDGLELARTRER